MQTADNESWCRSHMVSFSRQSLQEVIIKPYAYIFRLPQEILNMIFIFLSVDFTNRQWDWTIIVFVCRSWYECAMDHPDLWTHITFFNQRRKVNAFLQRSKAANLTVKYETGGLHNESALDNLFLVLEHLHRIRELTIQSSFRDHGWVDIFASLERSAPRLQHLSLANTTFGMNQVPSAIPMTLFGGRLPKSLKSFHVCTFALRWNYPMVEGLSDITHLTLAYLKYVERQPTFDQLLDVLDICKNLVKLQIIDIGPADANTNRVIPVKLPHLRSFSLDIANSAVSSKLLQLLEFPLNVEWTISAPRSTMEHPVIVIPQLFNNRMRCIRLELIFRVASILAIAYVSPSEDFHTEPIKTELHLHWENPYGIIRFDATSDICNIISNGFWRTTEEVWMQLHHHAERVPSSFWSTLLPSIPNVRTLRMDICSHLEKDRPEEGFVKELMPSSLSPHMCSKLSKVRLKNVQFSDGFMSRFRNCLGIRNNQVKRLAQLCIYEGVNCNNNTITLLREVVDDVVWDYVVRDKAVQPGDPGYKHSADHYAFS